MDPEDDKWIAKPAIHEELQQAMDKFELVKPTIEWYIRSEEEILRNYRTHSIPFDYKASTPPLDWQLLPPDLLPPLLPSCSSPLLLRPLLPLGSHPLTLTLSSFPAL
eukprot:768491-Hanusia_phi.AAC.7